MKWFYVQRNSIAYYSRITNMTKVFCMVFTEEEISALYDKSISTTDFDEIIACVNFMRVLSNSHTLWQNNLRTQDYCGINYNVLKTFTELLNMSKQRFKHAYALKLAFHILKMIAASVNGNNFKNENMYASLRIFDTIMDILNLGYYDNKNVYRDLEFKDVAKLDDKDKPFLVYNNNSKIDRIKQQSLITIRALLNHKNRAQFINAANYTVLMKTIRLGYIMYMHCTFNNYSTSLFDPDSEVSKESLIRIPLISFYLIDMLWKTSVYMKEPNVVEIIQNQSRDQWLLMIVKKMVDQLEIFSQKRAQMSEDKFSRMKSNPKLKAEALRFFDTHSSHIEVVTDEGDIEVKYFEILPAFLLFTRIEKKTYWLNANLDDSKSAMKDFFRFAIDKIDELFIQQQVENSIVCFPDLSKQSNLVTDATQDYILVLNIIVFFSYEVNDGSRFSKPKFFDMSSDDTILLMYVLGITIWVLLTYTASIQLWIMLRLQINRAINYNKDKDEYSKHRLKRTCQVFKYFVRNFEETLGTREAWCLLTCLIFSYLGVFLEFYYFAFTLVYRLNFNAQINEVIKSVWQPRYRILWTIVLSFVILYWFALLAYINFHKDFDNVIQNSGMSLKNLLIVIFDIWYKFDLGGYLSEEGQSPVIKDGVYSADSGRIAYDFMFFFVVPTLLLSILSGIIIDKFVERRAHLVSIYQKLSDQCFVCGCPANEIADFDDHCKFVHNLWDYMYYIGFLRSKHTADFRDYRDTRIKGMIESGDVHWFPCYKENVKNAHERRIQQSDVKNKEENLTKYSDSKLQQNYDSDSYDDEVYDKKFKKLENKLEELVKKFLNNVQNNENKPNDEKKDE